MTDTTLAPDPTTASDAPRAEPTVAVYPSAKLRPVPGFVFAVPAGWVTGEAPDALAVVRTPVAVNDFWVNALITHDRVAASVDLDAAAKVTSARILKETPGATVGMERVARFGDNVVYLRGIQFPATSGRELAQLQGLFLAPAADDAVTHDVFQVIGTAPAEVMSTFGAVFVALIASFQFT